jgi:hypothetical protein
VSRSFGRRPCIRNRLPYKSPRRSDHLTHSTRSSSHGRTHPPRSYSGTDWSSPGTDAPGRYPLPHSVRAPQDSRHRRRSRSARCHRRLPSGCYRSILRQYIPGDCTYPGAHSGQVRRGDRDRWGSRSTRRRSCPAPRYCSGSHGSCRVLRVNPADCNRPRTACRFRVLLEDRSRHWRSRGASCRHRDPASQSCSRNRRPVAMGRYRSPAPPAQRVPPLAPAPRADLRRSRRCTSATRRDATNSRPAPAPGYQTVQRPSRRSPHADPLRHR